MKNDYLSYEVQDSFGIITIDQINNSTNLYTSEFIKAYVKICNEAIGDDRVKGIIVTSGRRMFMAGGDLKFLSQEINPKEFYTQMLKLHRSVREVEIAGKPMVAAINGHALGGGYELALTCHHRISLDNSKIKIGLPESKVGLLPGGGGTSKLCYLTGIEKGLSLLLKGMELRPQQALDSGLIDQLANNQEELIEKSKLWILQNPNPKHRWDDKSYKIPGGSFWTPKGVTTIIGANGNVAKLTHGNYPAQNYILKVVHDGLQIPIDRSLEIEARYFTKIVASKEAKNIINTGFISLQKAKKGIARPQQVPKYEIRKIAVLGAGMMGAGIAYVSAKAGIEVILKDISIEQSELGKSYSEKLLKRSISKKRITEAKAETILNRIYPTAEYTELAECDLIVEAVFEDPVLKNQVTQEVETVLQSDKIYGSNTSTIPISILQSASSRPENFIGIHFFSPVDKMPLVEIIVGKDTNEVAIAAAVDFAIVVGKVPIVVNDNRGFFTSRCFGTYVSEGMFLLEEGVPAAMIENIAKKVGMPVGPLAVHDEVTLTLSKHVFESDPDPKRAYQTRCHEMVLALISQGRTGKKEGKGFYDYSSGKPKRLWPGLADTYGTKSLDLDEQTIANRLLYFQALESFRCLEEGVLRSSKDGDLGSVLGWGFPIYTGGALSYIDYVGLDHFIANCDQYRDRFGERFLVPDAMRILAKDGKSVHDYS